MIQTNPITASASSGSSSSSHTVHFAVQALTPQTEEYVSKSGIR
jgi:hypothetical protein